MELNDLITMLTDGLDPAEASVVRKAIERDAVKAKATTLRQQSEYDAINAQRIAFQQELEGQGEGKPGAKAYQKWYADNYPAVQKLSSDLAKYQAKYGTLEAPTAPGTAPSPTMQMTAEDIKRAVNEQIQQQYSPQWSKLLTSTGSLVQRHMFAGRKNPIDFDKLAQAATEKYNGDLDRAYDEWDKPEREKELKLAEDARVEQRVKDELAKRGASSNFPAAADMTPSSLHQRTKAETDSFDPQALKNDLAKTWMETGAA